MRYLIFAIASIGMIMLPCVAALIAQEDDEQDEYGFQEDELAGLPAAVE